MSSSCNNHKHSDYFICGQSLFLTPGHWHTVNRWKTQVLYAIVHYNDNIGVYNYDKMSDRHSRYIAYTKVLSYLT